MNHLKKLNPLLSCIKLDISERFYNQLEKHHFERLKMVNPYIRAWNKDNKFREKPRKI